MRAGSCGQLNIFRQIGFQGDSLLSAVTAFSRSEYSSPAAASHSYVNTARPTVAVLRRLIDQVELMQDVEVFLVRQRQHVRTIRGISRRSFRKQRVTSHE